MGEGLRRGLFEEEEREKLMRGNAVLMMEEGVCP